MNLRTSILLFVIFLYVPKMVSAQEFSSNRFKVLNSGTSSRSTIIALVDQETLDDPSLVFNKGHLTTHNISAYLFINTTALETLYTELNHLTRSNTSDFNQNALQFIIIGTQIELDRYQSLDLNYFSSHYFVSLDNSEANQPYTTIKNSDWNCEIYLEGIKGKYLWGIDKSIKSPKDSLIKHNEGKLTLGYLPVINTGLTKNNLDNYFTNGLTLDYSLGNNLQLYTAGSFTINRSNPEDNIQNQIFNQINIRDVLFGSLREQEVTLSIPFNGKFYASGSLGIRYLFKADDDFSLYASSELSLNNSTRYSGQLDTTFNLIIQDAFGGTLSNDLNSDDIDVEAIGIELQEATNINFGIGTGFQYKLSGHWRFNLSITYSTSIHNIKFSDGNNNNALGIALGLNFRFRDKKEYTKIHFY